MRSTPDAALGIDDAFLGEAMTAFGIGPSARAARAASQGTFHRLYDVGEEGRAPRLLRVAALEGRAPSGLMALEAALAARLRQEGFPVPACEYREIGRAQRGVHLAERAVGTSLTSLDDDEPRMREALAWVGAFLARLHRLQGRGFGPLRLAALPALEGVHARWADYVTLRLAEHLQDCESAGVIDRSEAAQAEQRFDAARPLLDRQEPALLHGDPGSHNFLVDAAGIRAVIDWEDALLGDPLFDLASLCTFHPERRHGAIFAAYGVTPTAGSEAWTRFWLYFLRIALAKTVHRRRFGYADRAGRPPASRRIQLALQRLAEAGR